MAARSVAELLPRPLAELELADVERMIAAVGEERESLFFERKAEVSPAALAKSCSAFANTMGGLLLVGIADECDELIGIEQRSSEAQVWVKDILRGHVLPLPPFRARFIALSDERSLLLVLVEESSTTPHLLTRTGAIYVRNPGASDPVPISDQRRLLDLLTRGERARERAEERARSLAAEAPLETTRTLERLLPMTLAVAPTGVADRFEQDLLETENGEKRLQQAHGEHADHNQDYRHTFWEQHSVAVVRTKTNSIPIFPEEIETLKVGRDGALFFQHAYGQAPERASDVVRAQDEVMAWIRDRLTSAQELLLDLGAHGDLRIAFRLSEGQQLRWGPRYPDSLERPIQVEEWTTLDPNDTDRDALLTRIDSAIGRALGHGRT